MAYKIQYSPQFGAQYPEKMKRQSSWKWIAGIVLTLLMIGILVNPNYRSIVKEILIPGDAEVTVKAVETLAQNLKDGVSIQNAVTAFCAEILDNAKIY